MNVALIQGKIFWEQPERNAAYYEKMLDRLSPSTQVVFFPEAFTTGFTMNLKKLHQLTSFPVEEWLLEKALEKNVTIGAGAFVHEDGKFRNRFYWVEPNGRVEYYDKRHLFTFGGEPHIFTPGNKRVTVEKEGMRFNLQICYDLRFPVWCANRYEPRERRFDFDVQVFIANWPAKRKDAYLPLLRARAVENQAYVIWVNRVGRDGHKMVHSGDSRIIHPSGKVLALVKSNNEGILEYQLSGKELRKFRESFPVAPDWDKFEIL